MKSIKPYFLKKIKIISQKCQLHENFKIIERIKIDNFGQTKRPDYQYVGEYEIRTSNYTFII